MGPRTAGWPRLRLEPVIQPEHANNRIRHDLFNWQIMESEHVGSSTVDDRTRIRQHTAVLCRTLIPDHGSRSVRSRSL